jgi:hypothetical protein
MIRLRPYHPRDISRGFFARRGITLLEVVVSLAIFIGSFAAIGYLLILGSDEAQLVQRKAQALQLAQTKLAEYAQGLTPLDPQDNFTPFDGNGGDPSVAWRADFAWKAVIEPDEVEGLYHVVVTVARIRPDTGDIEVLVGQRVEVVIGQIICAPEYRGSTADSVQAPDAATGGE